MVFSLVKIVFYGLQKLKGKHVFRKIEIIHVLHFVSSIAQKRNSVENINSSSKHTMLSNVYSQKCNIVRPRVIGILKTLGLEVFPNFFPCVYFIRTLFSVSLKVRIVHDIWSANLI